MGEIFKKKNKYYEVLGRNELKSVYFPRKRDRYTAKILLSPFKSFQKRNAYLEGTKENPIIISRKKLSKLV